MPHFNRLLTALEAAERLRLAPQTLAVMRVTGDGPPYIKVGSRVRYEESVLADWLDRRRHTSTHAPAWATRHGEK